MKSLAARKNSLKPSWHLYILLCADSSLYTGITNDLHRRLTEHATGKGAKYTRSHGASQLVYSEVHRTRSSAATREAEIKKLTRSQKQSLIKVMAHAPALHASTSHA